MLCIIIVTVVEYILQIHACSIVSSFDILQAKLVAKALYLESFLHLVEQFTWNPSYT